MKAFFFSVLLLASSHRMMAEEAVKTQTLTANATNNFAITGMTCEGCSSGLASELRRVSGVISAQVSLTNKLATVTCDTNRVSEKDLLHAIKEAGFGGKAARP